MNVDLLSAFRATQLATDQRNHFRAVPLCGPELAADLATVPVDEQRQRYAGSPQDPRVVKRVDVGMQ